MAIDGLAMSSLAGKPSSHLRPIDLGLGKYLHWIWWPFMQSFYAMDIPIPFLFHPGQAGMTGGSNYWSVWEKPHCLYASSLGWNN